MASKDDVLPITKGFLASYYDKHPFPSLSDDVSRISGELRSLAGVLRKELSHSDAEISLMNVDGCCIPHRIDENLWKNREQIEEIVYLLQRSNWPSSLENEAVLGVDQLREKFEVVLNTLKSFQLKNAEHVFNTVMTYMPQDFRGRIIRLQKERSERNKQADVDALISAGATIRDRYALLWKQQMERRMQLAQLGSATGVYKTFVRHLVGVPQVLLDFIRQINDDDGPMEVPRQRYGPPLYALTTLALSIRLFLHLLFHAASPEKHHVCLLQRASDLYTAEFGRFVMFINEVFADSPFFITAEEALASSEPRKGDDYCEVTIPPGKVHEVVLTVELVDSYIAWDFSLMHGKDIGFKVEYGDPSPPPSSSTTLILPCARHTSNEGNFCAFSSGIYKLVWDNSYSTFSKKVLRYKVECIPPVVQSGERH